MAAGVPRFLPSDVRFLSSMLDVLNVLVLVFQDLSTPGSPV